MGLSNSGDEEYSDQSNYPGGEKPLCQQQPLSSKENNRPLLRKEEPVSNVHYFLIVVPKTIHSNFESYPFKAFQGNLHHVEDCV